MPKKRVAAKSRVLDGYRLAELLTGLPCLLCGRGYFDYQAGKFDLESMRRDWTRHRDTLLAEWKASQGDGSMPWAAEMFDA